jgi:amino acid transporter
VLDMPSRGTFGVILTLHILTAVFVIGPMGVAAMTAPRLIRGGREALPALRGALRATRYYPLASVIVVAFGFAMVSRGPYGYHRKVTEFWILGSIVLWVIAAALTFVVVATAIERAATAIEEGRDPRRFVGIVAAAGGIASLCWVAIVVMMVIKPGA